MRAARAVPTRRRSARSCGGSGRARRRRAAQRPARALRGRALRARGEPARVADGAVRAKASGINLVDAAAGSRPARAAKSTLPPEGTACPGRHVKAAVLPFVRFPGADPVLGPEMRSTGEVMASGADLATAFAKAERAAGTGAAHRRPRVPERSVTRQGRRRAGRACARSGSDSSSSRPPARRGRSRVAGVEARRVEEGRGEVVEPMRGRASTSSSTPRRAGRPPRRLRDPRGGARRRRALHHDARGAARRGRRDRERPGRDGALAAGADRVEGGASVVASSAPRRSGRTRCCA